ncbi:MAG: SH3 domain-containing protein [Chloroflexota bacterium]|nr:SH3 domain-containing protein [Chloroflexota bacterium]
MSVAFPQNRVFERHLVAAPEAPIHWPSAVVGLVLAVVVVVGVSWLAQPRRFDARVAQAAAGIQAVPEPAVVPTPIPQPAVQPESAPVVERVRVTGTNGVGVNLRAQAGARAPRVKTLPEGTVLELVGADELTDGMTWRNVREPGGASGWVAAKFVARVDR